MIYFLINNNYHLDLDLKLASQLTNFDLGLIQVPYSLAVINKSDVFSKIYNFPKKIILSPKSPFRVLRLKKSIRNKIKPTSSDILIVHTERDLTNQYIIQLFYNTKAKIYILEDGIATICHFNLVPKKAALKDRVKLIILKNIFNFKHTDIGIYGSETLYSMKDLLFNGVILNFGNFIRRNIPIFKLTPDKDKMDTIYENGAIFFSQNLYLFYCTEKEYISYVKSVLDISERFSPFYFKFHPSDTNSVKSSITNLINEKYPNITIISENDIAEKIIIKYPVKYAITFFSTAALNLINKGVVPIFISNLFNNEMVSDVFLNFDIFLKSIKCNAPNTFSEIKPGFKAFSGSENSKTYTMNEILNFEND